MQPSAQREPRERAALPLRHRSSGDSPTPPTVNFKPLEKQTAETGALHVPTIHQIDPTCPPAGFSCLPVARGLPPASSRSAYPRTGDPSRPPRRLRLRIRRGGRRHSAGTLAERKATGARSSRPRSPVGAPELTRARSVRPGRPDFELCPPFSLIPAGAPPRTQVVLVRDGGEGLMQAVVPHCQRLALLTALVVAVLAEHHGQLLRRGSGDRVGKRKRAQSRPQASCGSPLFPNPQIGFGFLLGSSEREKGQRWAGTQRGSARVRVSRGS